MRRNSEKLFVLITASELVDEVIEQNLFQTRSQAHEVLSSAQDLIHMMRIPDLDYLVLKTFAEVRKNDFFRS